MNGPLRIAIGSEPMQFVPCQVLKASILRRTSEPVQWFESWTPDNGWNPVFKQMPKLRGGTAFSAWRWLVPMLMYYRGRAIYLDADQCVLADIKELWDALEPAYAFAAVCNAVGIFGKDKQPEPDHVQTSVMVMDCAQCAWHPQELFQSANAGKSVAVEGQHAKTAYASVMQAAFVSRRFIQELPPEWNHFGIREPNTKLIHWSHVKSQPYRNPKHQTADIFRDELREAVKLGLVTVPQVNEEVLKGHLHKRWTLTP